MDETAARDAAGGGRDLRAGAVLPIRYINLDRAPERRRFMEEQSAALGLPMTRAPAIASTAIPPERAEALNGRWERPLGLAELGCFLSHEALWREVAAGASPMMVLEDDVMLSRRLAEFLVPLASLRDVDFLNLESFGRRRFVDPRGRRVADGIAILRVHRDKSGSAAYILWPSGAQKLLARAERGAAPVDAFLHGLKGLVSFQCEPALAMQLHLLEARGIPVPIAASSSIQIPRTRLAPRPGNLPFLARRIATQIRLGGEHAMRLFGRRYRLVEIEETDFPAQRRS